MIYDDWVRVSDDLPQYDRRNVLLSVTVQVITEGGEVHTAYYSDQDKSWWTLDGETVCDKVVAWRSL